MLVDIFFSSLVFVGTHFILKKTVGKLCTCDHW